MTLTIDVDQHLFESRRTWVDYIDPDARDLALSIDDDAKGWAWLTWRGEQLYPAEVQHPGRPGEIGQARLAMKRGEEAPATYEDLLPPEYGGTETRREALAAMGFDAGVLFPNYGLIWENMLKADRVAQRANARAYNRWMAEVLAPGAGSLFGVAHLVLHDREWALEEIARLATDGIRLAMVAPAPVAGKSLSHPDLDPIWRAFCDHGVSPVFHVAGFESPLHPAWHDGDPEPGDQLLDSVFLWLAPGVALANMIYHGVFDRFPELRVGVVELTAGWVPSFLLYLDGAFDFYTARHGGPFTELSMRPSEYFLRNVKVAALPYEDPARLVEKVGADPFMIGSDWPHAEGMAHPMAAATQAVASLDEEAKAKVLGANAAWLLRL